MKWIYGKRDWTTIERGQENCFLLTNGLGGFSSQTMLSSVTRGDHALLMACLKSPNVRYNLVNRISEKLFIGDKEFWLSSQEFAEETANGEILGSALTGNECMKKNTAGEDGFHYLSCFTYESMPEWIYQICGVEVRKKLVMKQGANTIGLKYEIENCTQETVKLSLIPYFRFAPKGHDPKIGQKIERNGFSVNSEGIELFFRTNGVVRDIPEKEEICYHAYDICDGRAAVGRGIANHQISLEVLPEKTQVLELIYEMEPSEETTAEMLEKQKRYTEELIEKSEMKHPLAQELVRAADQFVSERESTNGDTILAGFPFFEDWGRDTMIALPGICMSTKQYEKAKSILRTFAQYEKKGLLPNLFPEGDKIPMYNSVDAPLLFIITIYRLYKEYHDNEFIHEMLPVMQRIVNAYMNGTEYGIHMDKDGLIIAGQGMDQVTWMDVRIGNILPTPRHGKPVEINAYWYNVLRIMAELDGYGWLNGLGGLEYIALAGLVKESFEREFWMEEKGYLKDVVSGTAADEQIRCNQIWSVSLPFSVLDREKEKKVVDTVFRELYTPYGLRTLSPKDPAFHPFYGGPVLERDQAYHQGTVWTFPLGGYYLSYLKVYNYSKEAKEKVRENLEMLECALREGCIGQLPEIYDGENPVFSKGCFAQAWSVGEILRVFEKIS